MARARANKNTTRLGQQRVDEPEGFRCTRWWIENARIRYHPHEAVEYQLRDGERFRACAQLYKPLRIALMLNTLFPVSVNKNIDIGHSHNG